MRIMLHLRDLPQGRSSEQEEYAAPPGPRLSHRKDDPEPPPYDPWLSVPDSTLLRPPPPISEVLSPTANADYDDAARAQAWCRQNPLWRPQLHSQQNLRRIADGAVQLTAPPSANRTVSIRQIGHGQTHIRTTPKCTDSIFLSDLPVYAASTQSPTTIYFEIKVLSVCSESRRGDTDAGIAIGLLAPPYPSWRLPGWERASLGVHGDDGRRYVDNAYGGPEFTQSFRTGDVVGMGMTFPPPLCQGGKKRVKVFFTRNGKPDGDWDLHEERDSAQDGGDVTGLKGEHDILAAVGCFGGVEFETKFRRDLWMYRP